MNLQAAVNAAVAEEQIEPLQALQAEIQSLLAAASKIELPPVPKGLEDRTDEYRMNRDRTEDIVSALESLQSTVISSITGSKSKQPSRIADSFRKQILTESKDAHTGTRAEISTAIKALQETWNDRMLSSESGLVSDTEKMVAKVSEQSEIPVAIDDIRVLWNEVQNTVLADAAGVLQSLRLLNNGVDLSAALEVVDESDLQSRDKIEQLNLLAQGGIAVEIISHDLEEMAQQTEFSLKKLPPTCRDKAAFKRGLAAFQSLVDRFRFLSPLSVTTYRARRTIKGSEISAYVKEFFQRRFESAGIDFESNREFELMEITDVPSRIFPVFVNLVNNSLYWLKFSKAKKIRLARKGTLVVVADSGPGVDKDDYEHLFEMFFTKRPQGRGIGLYLCRANLAVRGVLSSFQNRVLADKLLLKFVEEILAVIPEKESEADQVNEAVSWCGSSGNTVINPQSVLHALNTFQSSTSFFGEFITTGTILRRISGNHSDWLVAVEPACNLVPSQDRSNAAFLPCRMLELVKIKQEDIPVSLGEAVHGRHLFVHVDQQRQYFSIVKPSQQPIIVDSFVPKDPQILQDAGRLVVDIHFPNLRESPPVSTQSKYQVVAQLHEPYSNRLLHLVGSHLSRIGLDFISYSEANQNVGDGP